MKIKRYLLFTYDTYYPGGGWSDCAGSFDTLDEIREHLKNQDYKCDHEEVIDLETGKEIEL